MNKANSKFKKISDFIVNYSVYAIILFCFVSFVVVSVSYIINRPEYLQPVELLFFLPVIVLFVIETFLIIKSLHIKHFIFIWSLLFVLKSVLIILYLNSPPQGDGGGIFNEAMYLSKGGEFPLDPSNGYYNWYWLMWTVYIEKVLIDFLGVGYGFFKIIGMVCLLGSGLILFKIAKNLFSERISKISFGLYVLFSPIFLCVSHFSHQHLAFFFLMLSIYLLWSNTWYKWIIAGLTCGIMNGFRPWGILVVLSVLLYSIYCVFIEKKRFIARLLMFLSFIIVYYLTGVCINQFLIHIGYMDPQIVNNNTLFWLKIDSGIDPNVDSFRKNVEDIILSKSSTATNAELAEMKNELHKIRVFELLKTPTPYIYIANKMVRMFGEVDYWFENCFSDKLIILQYPYRLLYFLNWFQYIIVVIIAFIGKFNKREDKVVNILSIFTVGYFFAHVFIEAFSSYRLCIYPLLLIYAALGVNKIIDLADKSIRSRLRKT